MAASLPAAGAAANPALPSSTILPATSQVQVKEASPSALEGPSSAYQITPPALQGTSSALQGTADKGQKEPVRGHADLPTSAEKAGSARQKSAGDKAAEGKAHLEDVAKLANELQPTGSTLSTMQVHTKVQLHQNIQKA